MWSYKVPAIKKQISQTSCQEIHSLVQKSDEKSL